MLKDQASEIVIHSTFAFVFFFTLATTHMNLSITPPMSAPLIGVLSMGSFIALILLASSISLWSQENTPHHLLPKESFESLQGHASEVYGASTKLTADLRFSNEDERVLLHLPKRGFPWLASVLERGDLYTYAGSTLFTPELKLQSGSTEEDIAGELLGIAMVNRVAANRYACFHLVKELAPSPEATRVEKQAKELTEKMNLKMGFSTEAEFLATLEETRALFDQLKGLPQMTAQEYADERTESAALAPAEYEDGSAGSIPPDERKWPNQQLDRQLKWEHEGYLVAYSECSGPDDYERFQMVIKPKGGIFEANQEYSGSHFHPDSYESKLPPSELHALEGFLAGMPPSDATGADIHFIISFPKDGIWVTRTYRALPPENPFQPLLKRMIMQSASEWTADPSKRAGFLAPQ